MNKRIALTSRGRVYIEGCYVPDSLNAFENSRRARRSFPFDPDIVRRLREANPDAELGEDLFKALAAHRRFQRQLEGAKVHTEGGPPLMPHQRSGWRWLRLRRRGILADSQGMGKTVTSLWAVSRRPVVIACSKTKIPDWVDHVHRWTGYRTVVLEAADPTPEVLAGQALVMTYDAAQRHRDLRPGTLILDEAHIVRNRKTRLFADLKVLARHAEHVYLLTATPVVNRPDDVWTLLHLVDPDRFGSYWDFVARFQKIQHGKFGIKVGGLRPEEEENYWAVLNEYMLQRPKDESVLPRLERSITNYDLPSPQRAHYHAMLKYDIASHLGTTVEAVEAVAKITRLRQLAIDPGLLFPGYDGPSKLDALVPLVASNARPAVIFSMFAEVVERAAERLRQEGIDAAALTGEMSAKARDRLLKRFAAGNLQALVVTHGTGGEGLNLVAADLVVFLDLNWHPAGNGQARDRIYRFGQTADVVRAIYIRSVDTIEDHVLDILRSKRPVTVEALLKRMGTG